MKTKVSVIEYKMPFYEFLRKIEEVIGRANADIKYTAIRGNQLNERGKSAAEGLDNMLSGILTAERGNIAHRLSPDEVGQEMTGNPLYFRDVLIKVEKDGLYFGFAPQDGRSMRGAYGRISKLPRPEDLYDEGGIDL